MGSANYCGGGEDRRYDLGAGKVWVELVVSPVWGRESVRDSYRLSDQLPELRARVALLRGLGYTRGKTLGGLGLALRILDPRGKDKTFSELSDRG